MNFHAVETININWFNRKHKAKIVFLTYIIIHNHFILCQNFLISWLNNFNFNFSQFYSDYNQFSWLFRYMNIFIIRVSAYLSKYLTFSLSQKEKIIRKKPKWFYPEFPTREVGKTKINMAMLFWCDVFSYSIIMARKNIINKHRRNV